MQIALVVVVLLAGSASANFVTSGAHFGTFVMHAGCEPGGVSTVSIASFAPLAVAGDNSTAYLASDGGISSRAEATFGSASAGFCSSCIVLGKFFVENGTSAEYHTGIRVGPVMDPAKVDKFTSPVGARVRGIGVVGSTALFAVGDFSGSVVWAADWPGFGNQRIVTTAELPYFNSFIVAGTKAYAASPGKIHLLDVVVSGDTVVSVEQTGMFASLGGFTVVDIEHAGGDAWMAIAVDDASGTPWAIEYDPTSSSCITNVTELANGTSLLGVFEDDFVPCASATCIVEFFGPPAASPAPPLAPVAVLTALSGLVAAAVGFV